MNINCVKFEKNLDGTSFEGNYLRPVPNVVLLPCRTQMNLAWQWHDDGTVAVSNVEPNTVAPNSKDKTNHPSSVIVCK